MKAVAYDPKGRGLPQRDLQTILEIIRVRVGPGAHYSKVSKNGRTILYIGGYRIEVL